METDSEQWTEHFDNGAGERASPAERLTLRGSSGSERSGRGGADKKRQRNWGKVIAKAPSIADRLRDGVKPRPVVAPVAKPTARDFLAQIVPVIRELGTQGCHPADICRAILSDQDVKGTGFRLSQATVTKIIKRHLFAEVE